MKNFIVASGKNFDPQFKGAKAEICNLKGDDGGPQAVGQFYKTEDAELVTRFLNSVDKDEKEVFQVANDLIFAMMDAEDVCKQSRPGWQGFNGFSTIGDRINLINALRKHGYVITKLPK